MGLNQRRVYFKDRLWRALFILFILNSLNKVICGSRTSRLEDSSDYKIDFFRKTGKYPSTGYLESNEIYGTPLILKSQDSTLWIILFGVCLAAFVIGIGIFVLVNFEWDTRHKENGLDELESNEYFYDPLEGSEEIKHLNKLQGQFVDSLNNSNPNHLGYNQQPQFSQFANYYNSNQLFYSSRSLK